jgi:hypothetical protein
MLGKMKVESRLALRDTQVRKWASGPAGARGRRGVGMYPLKPPRTVRTSSLSFVTAVLDFGSACCGFQMDAQLIVLLWVTGFFHLFFGHKTRVLRAVHLLGRRQGQGSCGLCICWGEDDCL